MSNTGWAAVLPKMKLLLQYRREDEEQLLRSKQATDESPRTRMLRSKDIDLSYFGIKNPLDEPPSSMEMELEVLTSQVVFLSPDKIIAESMKKQQVSEPTSSSPEAALPVAGVTYSPFPRELVDEFRSQLARTPSPAQASSTGSSTPVQSSTHRNDTNRNLTTVPNATDASRSSSVSRTSSPALPQARLSPALQELPLQHSPTQDQSRQASLAQAASPALHQREPSPAQPSPALHRGTPPLAPDSKTFLRSRDGSPALLQRRDSPVVEQAPTPKRSPAFPPREASSQHTSPSPTDHQQEASLAPRASPVLQALAPQLSSSASLEEPSKSPSSVQQCESRTSTPIPVRPAPVAESRSQSSRSSSVPASEASRRTSPAEVKYRSPSPAQPPQVPKSNLTNRTPSPAVQHECRAESSRLSQVALSQEELRSHFSHVSTAELISSRPPPSDEQRKLVLTELAERISRSSSVASSKDSRPPSKSPVLSHKNSRASSKSPAPSVIRAGEATKRSPEEDLSAAAAAALKTIVDTVTMKLEQQEVDVASGSGNVDETKSEKTLVHEEETRQEFVESPHVDSMLSSEETKNGISQANVVAPAASNDGSPRPGLLDYYLGLRSGEYKLSSPSSSTSSRNDTFREMKSSLDDVDITMKDFAESEPSTTLDVDGIYNEIRELKFSEYEKLEERSSQVLTGSDMLVDRERVTSPLSSKGTASGDEGGASIVTNPRLSTILDDFVET